MSTLGALDLHDVDWERKKRRSRLSEAREDEKRGKSLGRTWFLESGLSEQGSCVADSSSGRKDLTRAEKRVEKKAESQR